VLRALVVARTTTVLAELLNLAPSSVSEQLTLLVTCQMVVRNRRANRVYYALSDEGARLLRLIDGDGPPSGRPPFG
jgi:DNA-binding transcriptional ArsR family regulator